MAVVQDKTQGPTLDVSVFRIILARYLGALTTTTLAKSIRDFVHRVLVPPCTLQEYFNRKFVQWQREDSKVAPLLKATYESLGGGNG